MTDNQIFTNFRISTSDDGNAIVYFETNDDNDDGYPDPEIAKATYPFDSLDKALRFTGKTRIGMWGQQVNVYLNGVLLQ